MLDEDVATARSGGRPNLPADRLAPLPPLPPIPDSRDAALDIALAQSPAIKQAELEERVARYQVNAAKGALLPTVDGSASIARRDEIVQLLGRQIRQDLATFQIEMKVPLFQGGQEYAAVRRARHVASLRRIEVDEATREIYAEVSTAWDRLVTARRAQAALANSITANETALAGVRREALVGSRTTLDILDAEQELRDSRIEMALSRHDEYVAVYRLLAAMGAISAAGFKLPVEIYQPDAHYRRTAGRWIGFGP